MKMLNHKIIVNFSVCLIAFMVFAVCGTRAMAVSRDELKQQWYETNDYPIAPGDEGWYDYGMMDMFDILNPPQELLESYTSSKLAELMMTYPYLWVLPSYDYEDIDYFWGYVQYSEVYNELMSREDGIKNLLLAYRNSGIALELLNSDPYIVWTLNAKVNAEIFGCQFVRHYAGQFDEEEMLLAGEIIAEKEQLYDGLLYSDTIRYLSFEEGQNTETASMLQLMRELSNRDGFTATGSPYPRSIEGVSIEFTPGTYSKYGVSSSCLHWTNYDYSSAKRDYLDNSIAYPWIMIASSSPKYNCHSYAWIISNTSNTYWLDSPSTFMGSSQMTYVGYNITPQIGDKIVYYNPSNAISHSAIVVSTPQGKTGIYVRSKVGGRALYDSPLDEVGIYHGGSVNYAVYRW